MVCFDLKLALTRLCHYKMGAHVSYLNTCSLELSAGGILAMNNVASLSEPHTSELNSGISYIYYLSYIVRHSVNAGSHSFNPKHCAHRISKQTADERLAAENPEERKTDVLLIQQNKGAKG